MKRSHLLTPARIEELSATAQKRAAQLNQRKLADLCLETPTPKPRKTLLYANISTPQEELRIDDGMVTDGEDDDDQLFTKKDAKMMVSEISAAINETLKRSTPAIDPADREVGDADEQHRKQHVGNHLG